MINTTKSVIHYEPVDVGSPGWSGKYVFAYTGEGNLVAFTAKDFVEARDRGDKMTRRGVRVPTRAKWWHKFVNLFLEVAV